MYINIEQNTSLIENVNIKIMSKLYELMTGTVDPYDDENLLDHNSNIVGSVNISYIYDYQYNFITHEYNNCFINYRDTYLYIKDPYVKQVLLDNNFGDDIGVLMSIARSATTIPNFGGTQNNKNTDIVSFDELQYFTNVTSLDSNFQHTGDQFLSVDLRNVRNISRTFYQSGIHQVKNFQNVVSIPGQSFENAKNLELLDVHSVTGLGWQSLIGTKLTELHFNDDNDIQFWGNNSTSLTCYALKSNTLLRTITGLRGTTSLKNGIFDGCSSLLELQLDSLTGDINFQLCNNCTSLTTFYAPNAGGTKINQSAFYNCKNLENLTLDFTNISEVSSQAFRGCNKVTYPQEWLESNHIETLGSWAFGYNYELSGHFNLSTLNMVTTPENVFRNCNKLEYVTLNSIVQNIGGQMFSDCTNLKAVYGLNNILTLNGGAFYNCKNLESLSGIKPKIIGGSVFHYCEKLDLDLSECTSITGNNSCYGIGNTSIDLTQLQEIGGWSFCECPNLTTVKWSDTLDYMGEYMFTGCTKLTTITNLNALKRINRNALQNTALVDITFPNVEYFDMNSVYNMATLQKVRMPKVKYLGNSAFSYCANLYDLNASDFLNVEEWHNESFAYANISTITTLRLNNIKVFGKGCFRGFNTLTTIIIDVDECFSLDDPSYNPFSNISSTLSNIYINDNIWDDFIQFSFYASGNNDFKEKFKKLSTLPNS